LDLLKILILPRSGRSRVGPEKVALQFTGAWMFEAEDLASLRIDPGHPVPDGAVFSRRVHGLKN
jgi:hypothetical protein